MTLSETVILLHNEIRDAGIPIKGLAPLRPDRESEPGWHVYQRSDGQRVRIDFDGTQTAGQVTEAEQIVEAFDPAAAMNTDEERIKRALEELKEHSPRLLCAIAVAVGRLLQNQPIPAKVRDLIIAADVRIENHLA
jgi:hypothetical protein